VARYTRNALLQEGVECLLAGDIDTGKSALREHVNVTMRMFLKIILVIVLLAVTASGTAIVRNGVPLVEKPGPGKRLLVYLSRNTAETRPDHDWPELRTRAYSSTVDELFDRVERTIRELGWEVVEKDQQAHTLHAVVSTPWLGFQDDVRIRLAGTSYQGTALNVRSGSRIGRADFGANAGHIMALHRALKTPAQ